jgi:hypothetical protein
MPAKQKPRPSVSGKAPRKDLANPKAAPPDWPPLRPLVPASDLSLEILVPDQIILIRNLFTSTLCKTLTSFMSSLPLETTPGIPKKGDAQRINDRYLVEDKEFARTLWETTALKDLILGTDEVDTHEATPSMTAAEKRTLWGGEVLGLNPNVRLYRYAQGQFFRPHCQSATRERVSLQSTIADVSQTTPQTRSPSRLALLPRLLSRQRPPGRCLSTSPPRRKAASVARPCFTLLLGRR